MSLQINSQNNIIQHVKYRDVEVNQNMEIDHREKLSISQNNCSIRIHDSPTYSYSYCKHKNIYYTFLNTFIETGLYYSRERNT